MIVFYRETKQNKIIERHFEMWIYSNECLHNISILFFLKFSLKSELKLCEKSTESETFFSIMNTHTSKHCVHSSSMDDHNDQIIQNQFIIHIEMKTKSNFLFLMEIILFVCCNCRLEYFNCKQILRLFPLFSHFFFDFLYSYFVYIIFFSSLKKMEYLLTRNSNNYFHLFSLINYKLNNFFSFLNFFFSEFCFFLFCAYLVVSLGDEPNKWNPFISMDIRKWISY